MRLVETSRMIFSPQTINSSGDRLQCGLLPASVRPYNPVHSVTVLALHLIFMFLLLTCVRINDDIPANGKTYHLAVLALHR